MHLKVTESTGNASFELLLYQPPGALEPWLPSTVVHTASTALLPVPLCFFFLASWMARESVLAEPPLSWDQRKEHQSLEAKNKKVGSTWNTESDWVCSQTEQSPISLRISSRTKCYVQLQVKQSQSWNKYIILLCREAKFIPPKSKT